MHVTPLPVHNQQTRVSPSVLISHIDCHMIPPQTSSMQRREDLKEACWGTVKNTFPFHPNRVRSTTKLRSPCGLRTSLRTDQMGWDPCSVRRAGEKQPNRKRIVRACADQDGGTLSVVFICQRGTFGRRRDDFLNPTCLCVCLCGERGQSDRWQQIVIHR